MPRSDGSPFGRRRLGELEVSVVGLGCNNFGSRLDRAETARVVHAALDAGIDFFDTAELYGQGASEQYLGAALRGRREHAVIATKFGFEGDSSPSSIRRAVEASLRRLGTDHIDLYQQHRPDPATPIESTLEALTALIDAGKVRAIGCSEYTLELIDRAHRAALAGAGRTFASVQNEYSLLHRAPEAGVLQACRERDLAFLPYFPLANGLLTGKYQPGQPAPPGSRLAAGWNTDRMTEASLAAVARLSNFAQERGRTLLELAVSWLAAQEPVASVIAGATGEAQVRANAAAAGWTLTARELAEVDQILST